jgi:hypothetical protein
MALYKCLHKLLNVLAQIANKTGIYIFLCGLGVRVAICSPRVLGFDFWCYQIFSVAVGLEVGPFVSINEELLERKSSVAGLVNLY